MTKHIDDDDVFYVYYLLRTNNLVAKIWPVFEWDKGEPVYGLMVDNDRAFELLSEVSDIRFTKQQLQTVLKHHGVKPFSSPFRKLPEETLLDDFYRKRKERKIRV